MEKKRVATGSGLAQSWRKWVATDDPLQRAANSIALLVASSQPFYPFGIVWLIGEPGWGSAISWATTPLFLAVPFLGHANAVLGRLLLVFAGTLVTFLVLLRLGPGSFVEAYHVPVLLLAACLFERKEQGPRALALALPAAAFVIGRLAAVPDAPEVDRLWLVHSGGALVVSAYVLVLFARMRPAQVALQAPSDSAKQEGGNSRKPF